jgi:hypothetical protein
MRYYFNIQNGVPTPDKYGLHFDSVSGAILHAKNLAVVLRAKHAATPQDLRVCVIDEQGSLIYEESIFDKKQSKE